MRTAKIAQSKNRYTCAYNWDKSLRLLQCWQNPITKQFTFEATGNQRENYPKGFGRTIPEAEKDCWVKHFRVLNCAHAYADLAGSYGLKVCSRCDFIIRPK